MNAVYYHATLINNVVGISDSGINPSSDGYVHLCGCPADAFEFGYEKALFQGQKYFIVFPVVLDSDSIEEYQADTAFSVSPIPCMKYEGVITEDHVYLYEEFVRLYSTSRFDANDPDIYPLMAILLNEILKTKKINKNN